MSTLSAGAKISLCTGQLGYPSVQTSNVPFSADISVLDGNVLQLFRCFCLYLLPPSLMRVIHEMKWMTYLFPYFLLAFRSCFLAWTNWYRVIVLIKFVLNASEPQKMGNMWMQVPWLFQLSGWPLSLKRHERCMLMVIIYIQSVTASSVALSSSVASLCSAAEPCTQIHW